MRRVMPRWNHWDALSLENLQWLVGSRRLGAAADASVWGRSASGCADGGDGQTPSLPRAMREEGRSGRISRWPAVRGMLLPRPSRNGLPETLRNAGQRLRLLVRHGASTCAREVGSAPDRTSAS